MTEHEDRTRDLERELEEMKERSGQLEDEIDSAREDWEQRKRDPSVPGAAGAPDEAEGDVAPEADYPGKGE